MKVCEDTMLKNDKVMGVSVSKGKKNPRSPSLSPKMTNAPWIENVSTTSAICNMLFTNFWISHMSIFHLTSFPSHTQKDKHLLNRELLKIIRSTIVRGMLH